MNNKINYSIIIPHKNTPELLKRCLDSITRRSDVQIIIVDDNSDSDVVDFDSFPGLDDLYIEIIFSKEGKGAGHARNIGLTKANGEWLLFADADDYFVDGFINHLDQYKDSEFDLIYFGINGINAETKQESERGRYYNEKIVEAIYKQNYDIIKYTIWEPWGKMIRRSLIGGECITFDETMVMNDKMFSIKTAYYANNIHFDISRIYNYIIRNNSLISIKTLESKFERLLVTLNINAFFISIEQKKFVVNIIPALRNIISIYNMEYFFRGIKMTREYKVSIFIELIEYCIFMPYRIVKLIRYKMFGT